MKAAKTSIAKSGKGKAKGTSTADQPSTGQLSIPQQILEGLREMSEFANPGDLPPKRSTVRHMDIDLEPGEYTPDQVRATREVFGLSQSLFAKFLGVDVSALRQWERGICSPSPVVRRFLDEMNAAPRHWRGRIDSAVRRAEK